MSRKRPDAKENATLPVSDKESKENIEKRLRDLDLATLESYIPRLYQILAETYADAGGIFNSYIIEDYLPAQAFNLVVGLDLISPDTYRPRPKLIPASEIPPEGLIDPTITAIDEWLVTRTFCNEFSMIIQPAIDALRKRLGETGVWKHPTPAELVQLFLDHTKWPKSRLIDKMADMMVERKLSYQDPLQAAKKQLGAVTKEPDSPTVLKDYHELLCKVMQENCSELSGLKPIELLWRSPA